MKKLSLLLLVLFLGGNIISQAQEKWDLESCIKYAIQHNIQLKQGRLSVRYQRNQHDEAKMAVYPNLNASANQSFQGGRTVDPFTNEFIPSNVATSNFGISSSMTLYNGMVKQNTIKKQELDLMAEMENQNKLRNNISLNIASAYLQILFDIEMLSVSKNKLEVSKRQEENVKKLVDAGSVPKGNLLEVQAQIASEELEIINAENQLRSSYLVMMQMLELPVDEDFEIEIPNNLEINENTEVATIMEIYEDAQELPRIKKAKIDFASTSKQVDIAKGYLQPNLSVGASYGTGYSDARVKYGVDADGNTTELDYPFGDQINDNVSSNFYFSLNIPIFNGMQTRKGISNAKINLQNSKYELESERKNLLKDIQQSHSDAVSALAKFKGSQKALDAMRESFKYTEQKFEVGMVNSVEYYTAKNQLVQTESDLIRAKYQYIFKTKVLDFYRGETIDF